MAKRTASYQLTAENFDNEEEREDGGEADSVGEFSKATGDVMSRRVIKKAKRRMDQSEVAPANPFSLFSSLKSAGPAKSTSTAENSIKPSFPISSIVFGKEKPNFTGSSLTDKSENQNSSSFSLLPKKDENVGNAFAAKSTKGGLVSSKANGMATEIKTEEKSENGSKKKLNDSYADKLTSLNISFLSWIKQHIEENPLIDLTPVFKDYSKHMIEIDTNFGKTATTEATPTEVSDSDRSQPIANISPVISKTNVAAEHKPMLIPPFSDNSQSKSSDLSFKPPVAGFFSSAQTSTPAAPISSSDRKESETKQTADKEEEDEDGNVEKHERKTIVEEDAFYTTRCKLFFKKGTEWKELGVGMLYLKPLNGKTQLLVRMETAGGKVLLNISLHENMPAVRVGKNNVSIVSVPNPPVFMKAVDGDNTKPLNYLLRVKDSNEADRFLKLIKDNKSKE